MVSIIFPVNTTSVSASVSSWVPDSCAGISSHYHSELFSCLTRYLGPITLWEIDGETVETVSDYFFGAPNSLQMVTAAMKLKDAYSLEGKL